MTVSEYANRNLPENYYALMFQDGYSPEEILKTAHRSFINEAEDLQEEESIGNVKITSEVNIRK